jgi:hypothetical protein
LIDEVKVKKYVQDLFYPQPLPKGSASATPTPKPTKTSMISQAHGKPVDGSGIPCVN